MKWVKQSQTYQCDVCGFRGPFGDDWGRWGTDSSFYACTSAIMCSAECRDLATKSELRAIRANRVNATKPQRYGMGRLI